MSTSKKGPKTSRKVFTLKELEQQIESLGSQIISLKGPFVGVSTVVEWKCAGCDRTTKPKSIDTVRKNPRCPTCNRIGTKAGFKDFKEKLEAAGYTVLDSENVYVNTKTLIRVRCELGHETTKNFNRVNAGFSACKICGGNNKGKYTMHDIEEIVEKKGKTPITYPINEKGLVDTHQPFSFVCNRCGNESQSSITNIKRGDDDGYCKNCVSNSKKADWATVEKEFETAGCTLITTEEEYVNNTTKLLYVCSCGYPWGMTSRKAFSKGARCFMCCPKRREETCLLKYGKSNPSQNDEVKLRIKEKWMEMYGVDHNMKVEEIKKKAIETNKKNNGGIHNLASEEIRIKAIISHIKKYGVPPGFSEEIREKAKQTCVEKYGHPYYLQSEPGKAHMKEKYDAEYFVMSEAYTEIMMKLYGVPHPLQNAEIFSKMMKSAFSVKEHKLPSGKVIRVQGYEGFAINKLLNEGHKEDEFAANIEGGVPVIKYTNTKSKSAVYYPDLYVSSKNMIIEVKSTFTYFSQKENNDLKLKACNEQGYKARLWVFDNKGECIADIGYVDGIKEPYHTSEIWTNEETNYDKIRSKLCIDTTETPILTPEIPKETLNES